MSAWPIPYNLKTEVLRLLGFPANLSAASIQLGYPGYASELSIYQPYAILDQKLTYLANAPVEAITCFGAVHPAFGSYYQTASLPFALSTPGTIANGATLDVFVGGAPMANAVAGAGETPTTMAAKLVASLSGDGVVVATAAGATPTLYATSPGTAGNGPTVLVVSSDPSLLVNGQQSLSGALYGGQDPPGPSEWDETLTAPVWGFVPICLMLERDLGGVRTRLSAAEAGDVRPRPTELGERSALLRNYRRRLADFLGVPLDPDIAGNRRGRARMRIV